MKTYNITCVCSKISYNTLSKLIQKGLSMQELSLRFNIGNNCKKCIPYIQEYINAR